MTSCNGSISVNNFFLGGGAFLQFLLGFSKVPVFLCHSVLEKVYAHDIDLHILFIDFKKAFDSINQKKLLGSLVSFGIPKKIGRLVKMTLEGAQFKVIVDGKISNPFVIGIGVKQGDGLSATLFNLVLYKALKTLEESNTIVNRLTHLWISR